MSLTVPNPSDEQRAVSPVIGVILMVAVTVLLGAIVSMLVLDMGSGMDATPQADFGFEMNGTDNVDITHEGGDVINASNLIVKVDGTEETDIWTGDVTAGDSINVSAAKGDQIRVIWSNEGQSTTLARYTVP